MGDIAIIKRQQLEQLVVVSTGGEREREMKREEHIRKYLKSRVSPFFSISFSPFVLISFFSFLLLLEKKKKKKKRSSGRIRQ